MMTTQSPSTTEHYDSARQAAGDDRLTASEAAVACAKEYAREHPEVIAMWALGIGFVLGWKLKPW